MARSAGDVLVKRNSKLEAFLQKHLDEDTFQRIRYHEACIVCSDTEDKAYKFVLLTDEWIYLTENPPKQVHPVVHLGDVLSIELVNEFPDFLSGEERDCCQHIRIKYVTLPPAKGKKKTEKNGSRSGATTAREPERPNARGSASDSVTGRTPPVASRATTPSHTTPRSGIVSARNVKQYRKTHSLHDFADSSLKCTRFRQLSLDASILRDALQDSQHDADKGSPRLPKHRQGKRNKKQKWCDGESDDQSLTSNLASTLRNRYSSSDYTRVRERTRPLPNPADEWDESGRLTDTRRKEPLKLSRSQSGELRLSLDRLDDTSEFSATQDGLTNRQPFRGEANRPKSFPEANGSKNYPVAKTDAKSDTGKWSFLSMFRRKKNDDLKENGLKSESNSSMRTAEMGEDGEALEEESEEQLKTTSLHLYILNYSSPVLMLTRTAWNNYLIRGTLMLDETFEKKTISLFSPRTARGEPVSKFEKLGILFGQLTQDLLSAHNSLEDTFELLLELKVAAERNCALKLHFWKKPDVFLFLIRQLQLYLPLPKQPLSPDYQVAKGERADQLEFVNLILESLVLMFRETEVLPSRLHCLKESKGKSMRDLVVMLTCIPWLPQRQPRIDDVITDRTASTLMSPHFSSWTSSADIDLKQLLEEFTDLATRVLYELILIAHQANWGDTDGSFLNICWLMNILDQLGSTTLVEYSPDVKSFVRNNFYEEFKYYIQAPVILQKLPRYYPIAPHTIRLMEEVMGSVLQKRVRLQLEQHYEHA